MGHAKNVRALFICVVNAFITHNYNTSHIEHRYMYFIELADMTNSIMLVDITIEFVKFITEYAFRKNDWLQLKII